MIGVQGREGFNLSNYGRQHIQARGACARICASARRARVAARPELP